MPVDVLPPLRRMEIENHIEPMLLAVVQHAIEARKTRFLVFERRGIIFEMPVIQRNPDNRRAAFLRKITSSSLKK